MFEALRLRREPVGKWCLVLIAVVLFGGCASHDLRRPIVEYRVFDGRPFSNFPVQQLNRLGAGGWEIASMLPATGRCPVLILERRAGSSVQEWEYYVQDFRGSSANQEDRMNKLGAAGWVLVGAAGTGGDQGPIIIFKRSKE